MTAGHERAADQNAIRPAARASVLPGLFGGAALLVPGFMAWTILPFDSLLPAATAALGAAAFLSCASAPARAGLARGWAAALLLAIPSVAAIARIAIPEVVVRDASDADSGAFMCLTAPCAAVAFGYFVRALGPTLASALASLPRLTVLCVALIAIGVCGGYCATRVSRSMPGPSAALDSLETTMRVPAMNPATAEQTQTFALAERVTLTRTCTPNGGCELSVAAPRPEDPTRYNLWDRGPLFVVTLDRAWLVAPPDMDGVAPMWRDGEGFDRRGHFSRGIYRADLPGPLGAPIAWSWGALTMLALALATLALVALATRSERRLARLTVAVVDADGVAQTRDGSVHRAASVAAGPALVDVAPSTPTYRARAGAVRDALPGTRDDWALHFDDRIKIQAVLAAGLALAGTAPVMVAEASGLVVAMPWTG